MLVMGFLLLDRVPGSTKHLSSYAGATMSRPGASILNGVANPEAYCRATHNLAHRRTHLSSPRGVIVCTAPPSPTAVTQVVGAGTQSRRPLAALREYPLAAIGRVAAVPRR